MQTTNSYPGRPTLALASRPDALLAPPGGSAVNCGSVSATGPESGVGGAGGAGGRPTHCLPLTPPAAAAPAAPVTKIHLLRDGGGRRGGPDSVESQRTSSACHRGAAVITGGAPRAEASSAGRGSAVGTSTTAAACACVVCADRLAEVGALCETDAEHQRWRGWRWPAAAVASTPVSRVAAADGHLAALDRDVVTIMPRNRAGPTHSGGAAAAGARRRQNFAGKGQSVSLDSAEGVDAQDGPSAEASATAAAHRRGSHSDGEEELNKCADSSQARRVGHFYRGKRNKSHHGAASPPANKTKPSSPVQEEKPAAGRATSPKSKPRRVDRLREFTERLRHTDLKWSSRDERPPLPAQTPAMSAPQRPPAPVACPAGSPPTSELPPSHPPRRRRKARPPRPPPICENVPVPIEPAEVQKTPIYKTSSAPGATGVGPLARRPLSDGGEWARCSAASPANSADGAASPLSPLSSAEAPAAGAARETERRVSAGSAESCGTAEVQQPGKQPRSPSASRATPDYYSQPRTIPFRSASFSRAHSSGIGRSGKQAGKSAITIEPVYFSINKPAAASQTLPKKFKSHAKAADLAEEAEPELKPMHVRHKSDPVVEFVNVESAANSAPNAAAGKPPESGDATTSARDSLLLDALLKEINQGASAFLGQGSLDDEVALLMRNAPADKGDAAPLTVDGANCAQHNRERDASADESTAGGGCQSLASESAPPAVSDATVSDAAAGDGAAGDGTASDTAVSDATAGDGAAGDAAASDGAAGDTATGDAATATAALVNTGDVNSTEIDGGVAETNSQVSDCTQPVGPTAVSPQSRENKPSPALKSGDWEPPAPDMPDDGQQQQQGPSPAADGFDSRQTDPVRRSAAAADPDVSASDGPAAPATADVDASPQNAAQHEHAAAPAADAAGGADSQMRVSNCASQPGVEEMVPEAAMTADVECQPYGGDASSNQTLAVVPQACKELMVIPPHNQFSVPTIAPIWHAGENEMGDNLLRLQQAQVDVLTTKLDQLDDEVETINQVHESFKQAVKMAVETLLSEVSAGDGPTDMPMIPPGAVKEREVAKVKVEGKDVITEEWSGGDEGRSSTKSGQRRKRKSTGEKLPPLLEQHSVIERDSPDREAVKLQFNHRFKSKSLSPIPFRYRDAVPILKSETTENANQLTLDSHNRAKSRSLEHRQRSFDLLDHKLNEHPGKERKRSLKRKKGEPAALSHAASHGSLSSSSSDEMRAPGSRSQTMDNRPKSDKPRTKSHGSRGRTTSDATTLRPLLAHQSTGVDMLNLEDTAANYRSGQRHASPSFLSYDSDVDRFPRSPHGPRRRLRGPYGEMLEGKMSRGDSYRLVRVGDEALPKLLASLAESGSPSPSPAGSSPRPSRPQQRVSADETEDPEGGDATPPAPRARLSVVSDGELVELEPASTAGHVRTVSSPSQLAHYQELLSGEEYYDGVGPTAESLISQLSPAEVGQMRAQPRKRGRRVFIIGELLDTEQSYVDCLRLLLSYYRKLREPELGALIDPNTLLDIFHMVPEILEIHEDFLRELVNRAEHWSSEQRIGEVFIDKLTPPSVLETYTVFVNNWLPAREALRRACQMKPGLAKFLENLERSNKRKLSFTHLFIMPVQRIPRYELLLKQLVSHTAADHPDLPALREALSEIHRLAVRINSLEQETMQHEALQQTLREVEAAVDGLEGIVSPDRVLVRHDPVTMTTALGTKKERMLFLFNDLLVIASVKRRAGATRKPSSTLAEGSLTGLDPSRYKLLMKIPLTDLNISRSKDENLTSLLKEVEKIEEDISTLRQIGVMVCKLHCNHYQVEELVKEMANVLNKQLSERHRADSQLMLLQLNVTTQDGIENISMSFFEVEKRTAWEQVFGETKQKLALSADRRPVPEFLYPLPIRKTRAGLQFTCAAATLSLNDQQKRDVWVCNSDGYVGHICMLSMRPEPTVTSCNGICNSRILCIAPVPAAATTAIEPDRRGGGSNAPQTNASQDSSTGDSKEGGTNIDLDSSSDSSDSDESNPEESTRGGDSTVDSGGVRSGQDQPTMWLGTEDGCIYVYNCNEYIRIKKTKVKVQLGSAVTSIVYLEGRVFVALANGTVSAYSRAEGSSWDMNAPEVIQVSAAPVNRLVVVSGRLWACSMNRIRIIDPAAFTVEHTVTVSSDGQTTIQALVPSGLGVWLCFSNLGTVRLFHAISFEMICEVDVTSAVTRMLSGCDDIIRQHKTACLRVTALMVCKELLWIGTSAGVILNLPLPPLTANTSWLTNTLSIAGISHGHTGHVRFLASVDSPVEVAAPTRYRHSRANIKVKDKPAHKSSSAGKMLVISGGDGYEDFRSASSELSGRDDSTNHLLLWRV